MVRGTWYAGAIGSERAGRKDVGGDVARLYDPLNCRSGTNQEERQTRPERGIIPLLEKHGYLEREAGAGHGGEQAGAVGARRRQGAVTLPFGSREFTTAARLLRVRRRVSDQQPLFRRETSAIGFSLARDSRAPGLAREARRRGDEQTIPQGPWTGKDDPALYLTRAGLVLVRHGGKLDRTDGLYLRGQQRPRTSCPGARGRSAFPPTAAPSRSRTRRASRPTSRTPREPPHAEGDAPL